MMVSIFVVGLSSFNMFCLFRLESVLREDLGKFDSVASAGADADEPGPQKCKFWPLILFE